MHIYLHSIIYYYELIFIKAIKSNMNSKLIMKKYASTKLTNADKKIKDLK